MLQFLCEVKMNTFKYNLIITRKRNKMTQKQMAELLNVTEGCYAHWEQGRNEPNIQYIRQLCRILHVTSDELLGIEHEEKNQQGNLSDSVDTF